MNNRFLEVKRWACIADARAYYLMQGFKSDEAFNFGYDILTKDNKEVMIKRLGTLHIISTMINTERLNYV